MKNRKEGETMSRNYEKEYKWQKEKYKILRCSIDKEKAEKLKTILKNNEKTFSSWLKEIIEKYIESK